MQFSFTLALLVAGALAQKDDDFSKWSAKNGKSPKSVGEYNKRMENWNKTQESIKELNEKNKDSGVTFGSN